MTAPLARRIAVWLPLVGVALWVVLGMLREVVNNDLFLHLHVGATVLDQLDVPTTDALSATAAGRQFIAHEWLSAVCFQLVDRVAGGAGLSLLRVALGLGCAGLLIASVDEDARRRPGTALALLVVMYVIALRAEVRPHMFTLLILCGYAYAIERWRARRAWRPLVWLIPLQVVWVNLHGGYLFGPVVLAVLAAALGLLAAFPALGADRDTPVSWRDVRRVATVAAACLAASCVNPYGPKIIWFSVQLSLDSDYVRSVVREWQSPLVHLSWRLRHSYWLVPFLAVLAMVWGGLVARVKARPVVDIAIAGLATYMAVRAMRFVPYVAIFGFAIAVRSWSRTTLIDAPTRIAGAQILRVAEVSVLVLFLVVTAARGFIVSSAESYPIGWGYGAAQLPVDAVDAIEREGLTGVVYNEYSDGAYLIYRLSPDVKPVMDSRIDIYGEQLHREYIGSFTGRDPFYAYLGRHRVDLVLMHASRRDIFATLRQDPGWDLVFAGEQRFVFAATSARGSTTP